MPSHGREDTEAAAGDPSRSRYERRHFRAPVLRPTFATRLSLAISRLRPVVSAPVLDEYIRVLAYPKFKLSDAEIRSLVEEELLPFIETVKVPPLIAPKVRDPDDAKFITCAVTAGVRWLVSGDDDLLSLHRVKSVEILSVTAFLQHLKRKP